MNAIYNSAELLGDSLNRFMQVQKDWAHNPATAETLSSLEADIKEDLDAVETILLSSRHQKRIADDVLHISKISGNLVQLVQNDWQPEEAVKQTLKMFNLEIQAKSISMQYERDPSLDMIGDTVIGDEGRFTQVCVNLLSNAIKFLENVSSKNIRICVGATPVLDDNTLQQLHEPDAYALDDLTPLCAKYRTAWPADAGNQDIFLHFSILDSGPGMSPEEQGRIFRRYAQASPKTYREFGGVGLGLWISRRLVELHGGAVTLQSNKGVGTVFRLYIRVGRKNAPAPIFSPALEATTPTPYSVPSVSLATALSPSTDVRTVSAPAPASQPSTPPLNLLTSVTQTKVEGRKPRILVVEG